MNKYSNAYNNLPSQEWNGVVSSELIKEEYAKTCHLVSDYAKRFDWNNLIELLSSNRNLVNSVRLNGNSYYTPLHQAALGGAPIEIVEKLIEFGAWRSLVNSNNETPLDIATKNAKKHLCEILRPSFWTEISNIQIKKIETNFHNVILERINQLPSKKGLRLPKLSVLFENKQSSFWFPVPGMYGGFNYWWDIENKVLVSDSWCRVVGGSGQRHIIKADDYQLIDQGFV